MRRIDTDSPHLQSNKAKDVFGEVHKLISAIKDALEKWTNWVLYVTMIRKILF